MIRVPRHLLLPTALVLLALLAPSPAAATPDRVILDCAEDGTLDRNYSNSDLRKARDRLPSDLDEYSDCREVIGAAIKSGSNESGGGPSSGGTGAGGGSTGGSGGGSRGSDGAGALSPAAEQAARARDQAELDARTAPGATDDPPSVDVGGQTVEPGTNGLFDIASASNSLPGPLLFVLLALGLLTLAGGYVALRSRVPALGRLSMSKFPIPRGKLPGFRR